MLIDSHAHLTEPCYYGGEEIISGMEADGLGAIICVGCDEQTSVAGVKIAEAHKNVYATVGVHPYYPETVDERLLGLFEKLSNSDKVVGIGEFGLDYHHDVYDRDAQFRAMHMQYELARGLKLPMVFHVREAAGDFTEFLRTREFPESGVMHCFSGSVETAEICLKKGLYLAFGGKLTYRNARHLAEVAAMAPVERILLETDAPYLTPSRFLGETNYPKYVAEVRDRLAEIRDMAPAEVERITAENTRRLFKKMGGAHA